MKQLREIALFLLLFAGVFALVVVSTHSDRLGQEHGCTAAPSSPLHPGSCP